MKQIGHPVDEYVGARLKIRRQELGITQAAMAEKVNITFQQIQKYESGKNRIGSSRLYEFSKMLKVPISYFFEGYEDTQNSFDDIYGVYNNTTAKSNIIRLVKYFNEIKDDSCKKSIIRLVKNMGTNNKIK